MKENVLTLTYDLIVYLVPRLAKFPRTQKFVLAAKSRVYRTSEGVMFLGFRVFPHFRLLRFTQFPEPKAHRGQTAQERRGSYRDALKRKE